MKLKSKNIQLNKAFTLYELVITITLFTLISGLVLSFISIMVNFTTKNDKVAARIQQSADVRKEIDYWFSYFDHPDYSLELVNDSKNGVCMRAVSKNGMQYELFLSLRAHHDVDHPDEPFMQALTAQYPLNALHGKETEIERENGSIVKIHESIIFSKDLSAMRCFEYNDSWSRNDESDSDIRFLIKTHVSNRTFAFEIEFA